MKNIWDVLKADLDLDDINGIHLNILLPSVLHVAQESELLVPLLIIKSFSYSSLDFVLSFVLKELTYKYNINTKNINTKN